MHTNKIKYNLYSIPYAVKMGAEVKIIDGHIEVKRNNRTIKFDMKLKSGSSYLMCAKMIPVKNAIHETAMVSLDRSQKIKIEPAEIIPTERKLKQMSFMKAHQILGHAGPKLTIETSRALGYKVRMKDKKCRFCGKAKSKQKNLKKKLHST